MPCAVERVDGDIDASARSTLPAPMRLDVAVKRKVSAAIWTRPPPAAGEEAPRAPLPQSLGIRYSP